MAKFEKQELTHTKYAWVNEGPNPFQADGSEEADINFLVEQFTKTGQFPTSSRPMTYMEIPQQDLNTVLSNLQQARHDEQMGYGAFAPSQDDLESSVTDENDPGHSQDTSEPIVQSEPDLEESEAPKQKTVKKVPKG